MKSTLLISVLFFLMIKDPCHAQNCVANFNWAQGGPNVINFTNTSTGTNPNTVYSWSFGDAQYGWTQNPSHTYLNPGTYYVCLTIYDSSFCQSTFCDSIVVTGTSQSCSASFSFSVSGNTVTFTNTSVPTTGMGYYWSFGDANSSSSMNPVHTYANAGNYYVCLTVWTINQTPMCSDTFCMQVNVGTQQVCNASFTYVVNGNTVTFTNTSTGGNFPFYTWTFGDAGSSNQTNPVHTYANAGTYWVCLTMQDSTCMDSVCQNITIGSSSVNDLPEGISSITLFPNPSTDLASIFIETEKTGIISVVLQDVSGRLLTIVANREFIKGEHVLALHTAQLNTGIYLVRFTTPEGSFTKRLSVLH